MAASFTVKIAMSNKYQQPIPCPTWTQIKSTPGVSTGGGIKESYTVEGIVKGATMNNEEKILQILAEIKSEQTEMGDLLQKVAVTQEAVVLPRLDLLAEGHQNLLDTLVPQKPGG